MFFVNLLALILQRGFCSRYAETKLKSQRGSAPFSRRQVLVCLQAVFRVFMSCVCRAQGLSCFIFSLNSLSLTIYSLALFSQFLAEYCKFTVLRFSPLQAQPFLYSNMIRITVMIKLISIRAKIRKIPQISFYSYTNADQLYLRITQTENNTTKKRFRI